MPALSLIPGTASSWFLGYSDSGSWWMLAWFWFLIFGSSSWDTLTQALILGIPWLWLWSLTYLTGSDFCCTPAMASTSGLPWPQHWFLFHPYFVYDSQLSGNLVPGLHPCIRWLFLTVYTPVPNSCPRINPKTAHRIRSTSTLYWDITTCVWMDVPGLHHWISDNCIIEKWQCIQPLIKPWLQGRCVCRAIPGYFCSRTNTGTNYITGWSSWLLLSCLSISKRLLPALSSHILFALGAPTMDQDSIVLPIIQTQNRKVVSAPEFTIKE